MVGNVKLIMVVHVLVMRWEVVVIVVVMRICSECVKVRSFAGVRGAAAATGGARCVRRLWGVAGGGGGTRTEVIVVVVVAGSWAYAIPHLSLPVVGDVDGVGSGVQGGELGLQLTRELDAGNALLWDGAEVPLDASPPARVVPPELHHPVKVDDVQEPSHQHLTRPLS